MYCAPVFVLITEIGSARLFLILGDMQGMPHKLVNTFVLSRRNRHYRNSQHVFHFINMYSSAVSADLIHHVQCQHHRCIQFHKLHGQIQVSFDVVCIHNVDDACRPLLKNELSGYDFLAGVRGKRVNARQVCYQCLRVIADGAAFLIHRYSGEVSHMLIGTSELVEQCGLAAVLIAGQSKGQLSILRQRMFICLGVILSALAQSRMLRFLCGRLSHALTA